jgi:hypothetical protein
MDEPASKLFLRTDFTISNVSLSGHEPAPPWTTIHHVRGWGENFIDINLAAKIFM